MGEYIWDIVLTGALGMLGFLVKSKFDEVDKIESSLTRTREEIARNCVTREEFSRDIDKLGERIDKLGERIEAKLDRIVSRSE